MPSNLVKWLFDFYSLNEIKLIHLSDLTNVSEVACREESRYLDEKYGHAY